MKRKTNLVCDQNWYTVELQWLEHLWNQENMFETAVVQASEYGIPEGTFLFRYLSEQKLKQGNKNRNQNKKYLVNDIK